MTKTNAMRLLDLSKIEYSTKEYTVKSDELLGVQVAATVGMSADEVFKTLVAKGDKNGINVFCIPVSRELNLKKAAAASGNKKIEMLPVKDILSVTGYVRGGCSPIGMKKKYPTYIDETALLFDEIGVSGGAKGCEIIIKSDILGSFINACFYDLT